MQRRIKAAVITIAIVAIVIGAFLMTDSRYNFNQDYNSETKTIADATPEGGSDQCESNQSANSTDFEHGEEAPADFLMNGQFSDMTQDGMAMPDLSMLESVDLEDIDLAMVLPPNEPKTPSQRLFNVGIMSLIILFGILLFHTRRKYRWQLLLMTITVIYFGFINHGCICPIGSTGHVANAVAHYGEVRLSIEAVLLFFIPLIVSLFFGRIFCGSACPLGAIQEVLGRWETKIPKSLNKVLGFGRLLILIWLTIGAVMYMTLPVCQYDPFVKIFRFSADTAGWIYAGGFLLLTITVKRPFCRYLCPYGLILGIFAKIGFKTRKIVAEKCVSCNKCVKTCPVDCISLPKIDSFNCVCCGKCSQICPTKAIK